jgi:glycosyltransferase involved in cell wall biosynthesis
VAPLMEAIRLLQGEPMEFWFVGPIQISIPAELQHNPQVKWMGAVPRGETAGYYQQADVFMFRTLSDGFGLTQLEAQAWRLPIVASRFCGEVVEDGVNGVQLREVSGEGIAQVLMGLVREPERLRAMAARSFVSERFSLNTLGAALLDL